MNGPDSDLIHPTADERKAAKILVVGGDPEARVALVDTLRRKQHRCSHVYRLEEARSAVARNRYDLILLNPALPDGDGLELAQLVQQVTPATKVIILSETGSFSQALRAMRSGAVDFINAPLNLSEIVNRVDLALRTSSAERTRERKIRRLQSICKELTVARKEIADQVDTLCNDLVTAYHQLTEQINDVAMATEFRTLLRMELDIEELLRTSLEYLLSKTGPTNAAVFLPDGDGIYNLGAYVNYDCPREMIDSLLDHLCKAICPQMAGEEEIVAFDDAREFAEWIGASDTLLADSQVVAFSCQHEGECLAVIVLFRSVESPFNPTLAGTLDILRATFAEQLSRLIRVHHRARPQWPDEAHDDEQDFDDFGWGNLAA